LATNALQQTQIASDGIARFHHNAPLVQEKHFILEQIIFKWSSSNFILSLLSFWNASWNKWI